VGDAESGSPDTEDAVVDRARGFLHAHVADTGVDLRQVAAAAHVSAPHLVRRFRAERGLGITPIAHLRQRRVAIGVDLLVHTQLPVADVAARSGFKSTYHFSRQICKHTGLSPTKLRRQRWCLLAAADLQPRQQWGARVPRRVLAGAPGEPACCYASAAAPA
jgi:AraC-like DNA-binding protein